MLGLAPGIAWLIYFFLKKNSNIRSYRLMVRVFLWGCASALPALLVEVSTGAQLHHEDLPGSAIASFLIIAPTEEFFKLLAVWLSVYRSPNFRDPLDGIIYAATAALAFASVENIVYIMQMGPGILFSRTVYATPAHVMFASMWGASMGLARFRRSRELFTIGKGFLIATGLHGLYDFVVALNPKMAMFSLVPLMLFMAWLMNRRIKDSSKNFPFLELGEGAAVVCPNCGAYTLESEVRCSRCGKTLPPLAFDTPRFCGRCRTLLPAVSVACPRCGNRIVTGTIHGHMDEGRLPFGQKTSLNATSRNSLIRPWTS